MGVESDRKGVSSSPYRLFVKRENPFVEKRWGFWEKELPLFLEGCKGWLSVAGGAL